ncbi:hypothetical protein Syun_011184 [Stephania yunnanensis]|uniref:Uncharacterized protein n=1 Tax=Stephania yunnanensis TaxID=152371 RepID=A0AAP0JXT4_9MAGN
MALLRPLSVIVYSTIVLIFLFSADCFSQNPNSGLVSLATRRFVAEVAGDGFVGNSTLLLAEDRTRRKDPLDGYKKYGGGWNISNEHYWASVGYTAAPLFVVAAAWFVIFGLTLFLSCCYYCCCSQRRYGYSRAAYALSLILLTLFTISAIVGCVMLYTGQGKFHGSTTDTLKYVVSQANLTVENLHNVSDILATAKKTGVDNVFLPSELQTKIDQIETKINDSSVTLASRTNKNSDKIQNVLDDIRLALIIIAAVMLGLAFLGFIFSILGMQFLVYILVVIGWILVTGTFILCGVFLLLHNVVGDTCVAMDEWVVNPTAHTALDDILLVLTNVSNVNFSPNFKPLYYNQSGPLVPILCNPFHSDLSDRACSPGEADLNNATQVWRNYICQVSPSGICTTVGRLTPDMYSQMSAAVSLSYGLNRYGPFLVQLQDCTFVRDTFREISLDYCPGLRRYSEYTYAGLVMVSAAVGLSLIFWVIYARERRHRVYTKRFDAATGHGYAAEYKG